MSTTVELAQGLGKSLLTWSISSIIVGSLLYFFGFPLLQGIGLMAILWGFIDLIIAGYTLKKQKDSPAADLAKVLLINVGLDIIYQAIGLLLILFGWQDEFMIGNGIGIIIQGAFLFVLDLFYYRKMKALIP
ncbi:MAG: hypothetical protein GF411_09235 [Candidatus Lokiarchaeota archaeon]|nr:hypothetical protein [Candidatus Lokiarchaeota archaeon]